MIKEPLGRAARAGLAGPLFVLLLALTVVAPLLRGLFFAAEQVPFAVVVGLLALGVAVHCLLRGRLPLLAHPLDWAAAAVALGYLAGYLHRPVHPLDALQAAVRSGMELGWYWLAAVAVAGVRRVAWYAHALLASGALLALLGCLAAAGHFPFPAAASGTRILSTLQYPNALGAVLVGALLLCTALAVARWTAPVPRRTARLEPGLAAYGAVGVLLVVTLLGTASRGAWLVLPLAAGVWWWGLGRAERTAAVLALGWPAGVGVLLSRPILDAFWAHQGGAGLAMLGLAMAVGGAGFALRGPLLAAWERQRLTPEMRWVLRGTAALYGVGVVVFLLASTAGASAMAGRGLVATSVAQRAGDISADTPDLVQRWVMWRDGLHLVARNPWLGFGGGAWQALYHGVQSAPYWSTQAHEAVLQAWLGGGLAAALGLAAVGPLLLWTGWRHRAAGTGGPLLWGLATAAFALWLHSLADFDLSLPAVALILWGSAGALRGAAAPLPDRPARWPVRLTGFLAAGVLGVLVVAAGSRLARAQAQASLGAQALQAGHYAQAYTAYRSALALTPLMPNALADEAQLSLLAYRVGHDPALRQQAADQALAAIQFGPGDLAVASAALDVLVGTGRWQLVADQAEHLLGQYPLDPDVAAAAGPALVQAAIGEIGAAAFDDARSALAAAAGLPGRLTATPGGPGLRADPATAAAIGLAAGQALALQGRWQEAGAVLAPLVTAGNGPLADEARTWLSVAQSRSGQASLASTTFAPLAQNPTWQQRWNEVSRLTAFASEVGGR